MLRGEFTSVRTWFRDAMKWRSGEDGGIHRRDGQVYSRWSETDMDGTEGGGERQQGYRRQRDGDGGWRPVFATKISFNKTVFKAAEFMIF